MSSHDENAKTTRIYDRRVIDRNIKKGLLSRKDYEKFLKGLPDVADKICPPEERAFETVGDDDDDRDDDDRLPA